MEQKVSFNCQVPTLSFTEPKYSRLTICKLGRVKFTLADLHIVNLVFWQRRMAAGMPCRMLR